MSAFSQAIIVRRDIKMDRGKTAAQVAHASLEAYKKADTEDVVQWEAEGMKKVVLRADDLKHLMRLKDEAKEMRLPYSVIRDAGKTQIEPGTVTSLGIGPAEEEKIIHITKNLKLL